MAVLSIRHTNAPRIGLKSNEIIRAGHQRVRLEAYMDTTMDPTTHHKGKAIEKIVRAVSVSIMTVYFGDEQWGFRI